MAETYGHDAHFEIKIDRMHYTVRQSELTGAQLRALVSPPVLADRDLYEVRPGGEDILIADDQEVRIHNGLRFFTAPGHITPGSAAAQ